MWPGFHVKVGSVSDRLRQVSWSPRDLERPRAPVLSGLQAVDLDVVLDLRECADSAPTHVQHSDVDKNTLWQHQIDLSRSGVGVEADACEEVDHIVRVVDKNTFKASAATEAVRHQDTVRS